MSIGDSGWLLIFFCSHIVGELIAQILSNIFSYDKICASVDILPTILNLLGMKYDSRLLAGRDILYDEPGYFMLPDYSYKGEDICYDMVSGTVVYSDRENEGETANAVYDRLNWMEQKYYMSDQIIETDYFRYYYGK